MGSKSDPNGVQAATPSYLPHSPCPCNHHVLSLLAPQRLSHLPLFLHPTDEGPHLFSLAAGTASRLVVFPYPIPSSAASRPERALQRLASSHLAPWLGAPSQAPLGLPGEAPTAPSGAQCVHCAHSPPAWSLPSSCPRVLSLRAVSRLTARAQGAPSARSPPGASSTRRSPAP